MTIFLFISLLMGWGKTFDTNVLIYMHWVIISHSEKLSDTIVLGKCAVHFIKSQYSLCTIIAYFKSKAITQVLKSQF